MAGVIFRFSGRSHVRLFEEVEKFDLRHVSNAVPAPAPSNAPQGMDGCVYTSRGDAK